jgi:hypothetical protein
MFDVGRHSFCLHQLWKAGSGPVKDIINIGENPQFSLEVCFFIIWFLTALWYVRMFLVSIVSGFNRVNDRHL